MNNDDFLDIYEIMGLEDDISLIDDVLYYTPIACELTDEQILSDMLEWLAKEGATVTISYKEGEWCVDVLFTDRFFVEFGDMHYLINAVGKAVLYAGTIVQDTEEA